MAFLRMIERQCQGKAHACDKIATQALHDRDGMIVGRYCDECATKELAKLTHQESREA